MYEWYTIYASHLTVKCSNNKQDVHVTQMLIPSIGGVSRKKLMIYRVTYTPMYNVPTTER